MSPFIITYLHIMLIPNTCIDAFIIDVLLLMKCDNNH